MHECKIAEKLVELRTAKGITQDEVAQSLSVSNKTVSKWENGSSAPDLDMLIALSEYYGVTCDHLLGISDERRTEEERMRSMFRGMDRKDVILSAFETIRAMFPAAFEFFRNRDDGVYDEVKALPTPDSRYSRSMISTNEFFDFLVCSEDVNAAVMLLRNESNFAWMKKTDSQKQIIKLFKFLSSEDALTVLYFIHSTACSDRFTADYVSKNTGVDEARVTEILDDICNLGTCRQMIAHLDEGEVKVYECFGDGILLSLICLAYEKMCGREAYNYCNLRGCKMIKG